LLSKRRLASRSNLPSATITRPCWQMKANKSDVLLVGDYVGKGASQEQFIKTFATASKRVVFVRVVDARQPGGGCLGIASEALRAARSCAGPHARRRPFGASRPGVRLRGVGIVPLQGS